ncbi:LLM class flavin-dependent oxidoreductase [Spirillospora sp. NBC_01491]|uniref:LLM class flavin-dependent oxidoreductase n=1 Tax=Spirillospora sp. NBC_01491 TaxID=2976007 RepID=UPI002E31C5A6|nr:LLM class flavin-dependent oxidoreductase [Spirillospora sp. NBC_01491]
MTSSFVVDGQERAWSPMLLGPGSHGLRTTVDRVRLAEEAGVDQLWLGQNPDDHDVGVMAAGCLAATTSLRVGTAVAPIPSRHPVAMGQLATGLADLSGDRFLLGLGAGHPFINEFVLGLPPVPPVAGMREYLTILRTYLQEGRVDFAGAHYGAHASNAGAYGPRVPVYLGAMRPKMIQVAVRQAEGLLLWLTPPRYIEEHVLPVVRETCAEIGRDPAAFPILAGVPVYLPDDHPNLHADLEGMLTQYAMMPSYRHVMEASGHADRLAGGELGREMIDDLAIVGDPDEVAARLEEYRAIGCVPLPAAAVGAAPLQLDGAEAFARFAKAVCVG